MNLECVPADFNPRKQFARWFTNKNIEDNDFPKYMLFTDKATFKSGGVFNRHTTCSYDRMKTLTFCISHHQHRFSVMSGLVLLVTTIWLPINKLTGDLYEVFLW